MDFFTQLEESLRPEIDKILTHPFIKRIEDGWLNEEQLKYFAKQYGVYCRYFPRFLAAAASHIPDDQTRLPIVENLWEEHGSGDLNGSHRVLYERFAKACGVSKAELESTIPLPEVRICVENLLNSCTHDHFLFGLGALGPGTEFFTGEEYSIIETGMKKYDFLSPEDYYFWTVHISLDEEHYSGIVDAMRPWIEDEQNRVLISSGAGRAIHLEQLFWDGLEENLPNK